MKEKFMQSGPKIAGSAWIHPSAVIIGRVKIGACASVWPGAVLRGDVDAIDVGDGSNIQDLAVLHANYNKPVTVGAGVTVGHGAIIHGSRVGDHCLIGMGAIVMDAEVGEFSLIGAGAVLTPGTKIPAGSLVIGTPGRVARKLGEAEKKALVKSKEDYLALSGRYRN